MANLDAILGFCAKAGKLAIGAQATRNAVSGKKAQAVLLSPGASENTRKEIGSLCARANVRMLAEHDFSSAIGRPACKVAAVIDAGFAKTIFKAYDSSYATNN